MRRSCPIRTDARRRPGTALAAFVAASILAVPAAAQEQVRSAIAGIALPYASQNWSADPDGYKGAEIDMAAGLAARTCASKEFHRWQADPARAETIAAAVDAALASGGWQVETISEIDGQRTALARRGGNELVMRWLPDQTGLGWLICLVEVPPGSERIIAEPVPETPAEEPRIVAPAEPPATPPIAEAPVAPPRAEVPPPAEAAPPVASPAAPAPSMPAMPIPPPMAGDLLNGWLPWIAVISAIVAGLGIVLMVWSGRQADLDDPAPYPPRRRAMDEDAFEEEMGRPYEPAPRPAALAPPARERFAAQTPAEAEPPSGTELLPPAPATAELPPPAGRVGAVRLEEAVATALAEFRLANDEIATTRIEVARVVVQSSLTTAAPLELPPPAEPEAPAPPTAKGRGKTGATRKAKPGKAAKPKKAARPAKAKPETPEATGTSATPAAVAPAEAEIPAAPAADAPSGEASAPVPPPAAPPPPDEASPAPPDEGGGPAAPETGPETGRT